MKTSFALLAALLSIVLLAGCQAADDNLGAACLIDDDIAGPAGVTITSPSLECASRTCLRVETTTAARPAPPKVPTLTGHCTDLCETDSDCADADDGSCAGGYSCVIPAVTGPFCCMRMCVCSDDLAALPAPQPTPAACLVADPANSCCNLPGRGGDC